MKKNITLNSIRILFLASPLLCSMYLIADIIFSIIPIISAKLISQIVNIFSDFKNNNINTLINIVIFYICINILIQILSPIRTYVSECLMDIVAKNTEQMLNKKICSFKKINCFEDNEFYNELRLAKNGSGARLISSLQMISSILRGVISITLTVGYMLQIHWIIGSISLISLIPNTVFNFWVAKNKVALFRSQSESARKLQYYSNIISSSNYAKEIRLFRIGNYILDKYDDLFKNEYKRINKVRVKQMSIGVLCSTISALINGVTLFVFISMAISEKMEPGNIILYISLLPQFINGLQMFINGFVQTKNNNYYIKNFLDFIEKDVQENIGALPLESKYENTIEFKDVSFHYPCSNNNALKNINFKVKGPAMIAIVGENGSGKSTLVKLLMRMFDVSAGDILINNLSIKDICVEDLRKQMSGVFQDPARFAFSIRENLGIGNIDMNIDDKNMMNACKNANLEEVILGLDQGLDTMLGKEFANGIDLSGGQWQKISLARAFCSNASFLIFDEASSDLDPKAEKVFYDSIKEFAKDKITFYITHRLSGTKDADLILVLDKGELAEIGNHSELIKQGGIYKTLYSAQAMGYDLSIESVIE